MNNDINVNICKKNPINIDIDRKNNLNVKIDRDSCIRSYPALADKPEINGNTIIGNMTPEELGIIEDKNYVHNQTEASDTWVIVHNLNKYPSVSIINSAKDEVIGDVIYDNLNQITITFTSAFKGKATLN